LNARVPEVCIAIAPVGGSNVSRPLPATPCLPSVNSTLSDGLSLSTSWPMTMPAAFFADIPNTVASSLTSLAHKFPFASIVKP